MPQLSLKISKNIDIHQVDFRKLFVAIHEELRSVPDLDISTCHSGVIQEEFSYIGLGDDRLTKLYLEIYWIENEQRFTIKKELGQKLLKLLEELIVPQIEKQQLICIPRVRIVNLGELEREYHISKRS